jgi:hypothetical protein
MYIGLMKNTLYSCQILMKQEFHDRFSKKYSNSMTVRPLGAELFHADGRTDRHDEANFRFS